MTEIPEGLEARVQWLVDREAIRELTAAYTRRVDEGDFAAWAELFTEDGVYITPERRVPKAELAAFGAEILKDYSICQHLLGQHAITIDGDTARGRIYYAGFHVLRGGDPGRHADIGGWYFHSYRRTPQGWRFAKVGGRLVWASGERFPYLDMIGPKG